MLGMVAPAHAQEMQGLQSQTGPRLDFPAGWRPTAARFTLRTAATILSRQSTRTSKSLRVVAGTLFQQGSNDGVGPAARFNSPDGMTINGQDLYLCDTTIPTSAKINVGSGHCHDDCWDSEYRWH